MRKPTEDDFDESTVFSQQPHSLPMPPARSNPLAAYFRAPGVHVHLPTGGQFLPPGGIELTMTGEVPVLPMRGADELLLKSPDALMSGYAIEKLIESCVPAVKLPRLLSMPDLDVLLLAIRAATHGDMMSITAACPKCSAENDFDCNLPAMLATMKAFDSDTSVRLSDEVVVHLRPHNFENATKISLASFEETRKLQALDNRKDAEERERQEAINAAMQRLANLNQHIVAECVVTVSVPEAEVSERRSIAEFISNIPKPWSDKISERLAEMNQIGVDKTVHATCAVCKHEWSTQVEFDPASFFDGGSSK